MGYDLTIGEAKIEMYAEDHVHDGEKYWESAVRIEAPLVTHDDAPAFGNPTDRENQLWPSYGGWASTMEISGLESCVMYDGSMRGGHPGAFPITKQFVEEVEGAKEKLTGKGIKAEYGTEEGAALCRVTWLAYWSRWALENCKNPVLANS